MFSVKVSRLSQLNAENVNAEAPRRYVVLVTPTFADLAKAQYILLTTFTKDGKPKPTPIWAALDKQGGDRLLVITQEKSWKVKRIRNTPRVTLATCAMNGRPTSEAVEGTAAILDKSQTAAVYDAIGKRYGVVGKVFNFFSKLRGGMDNNVGLELKVA
jgi:PPOX class probable F420-dependent enzyme